MSKAALTLYCELLDGPSWDAYYRVYNQVACALRTAHVSEASGGPTAKKNPATEISEELVVLPQIRNDVGSHLRENVTVDDLIRVFHLLQSTGGRFYSKGVQEKWYDELTLIRDYITR